MTRYCRDSLTTPVQNDRSFLEELEHQWRTAEGTADRVGVVLGTLLGSLIIVLPLFYLLLSLSTEIKVVLLILGLTVLFNPALWAFFSHPTPPPRPAGVNMSDRQWKKYWVSEWQQAYWAELDRQQRTRR